MDIPIELNDGMEIQVSNKMMGWYYEINSFLQQSKNSNKNKNENVVMQLRETKIKACAVHLRETCSARSHKN